MIDFSAINVSAIIEVFILYLVIYSILKAAKGSRFGQALMGVGILAAAMIAFTYLVHFDVLSRIVKAILIYLAISSVVIFQPEIRRILSQVGAFGFFDKRKYSAHGIASTEVMLETIISLAKKRIGALIAFERGISLRGYEDTGVAIDAMVSKELVTCIFTPHLPLHDGGITIRNGRLAAAHCVFPVSNNPDLITSGMRHRAAVGLSEETDALIISISEETGAVSIAHNGKLFRYENEQIEASLPRWINKAMPAESRKNIAWARIQSRILNSSLLKGFKK
jgi:diadenylate cyclase